MKSCRCRGLVGRCFRLGNTVHTIFLLLGLSCALRPTATGQDAASRIKTQIDHLRQALESAPKSRPEWKQAKAAIGTSLQRADNAPAPPQQPQFSPVEFLSLDRVKVTADLYSAGDKRAITIVLVHQSGASRGEYRQIAPHLQELGFNALAIDSRWGERDRWNGVINETAARLGTPAIAASGEIPKMRSVQQAAAQDIRAALKWLNVNHYTGAKILWGSSISANLVLKVAADPTQGVAAVLSFSPGEYYNDQPNELRAAIKGLLLPTLIACGVDEEDTAKPVFDAIPSKQKVFYRAINGRHGASILIDDPENWTGITPFLVPFEGERRGRKHP